MSWSLEITHGDLALGTGGLATVQGANKLVQDLRCAILEPMGTDPLHPSYGSVIDGGIGPSGQIYPGVIGSLNDSGSATFVESEVQRIAQDYQQQQIARQSADVQRYGKGTLTVGEALIAVTGIDAQADETNMLVQVTLQTGSGDDLAVAIPVSTTNA